MILTFKGVYSGRGSPTSSVSTVLTIVLVELLWVSFYDAVLFVSLPRAGSSDRFRGGSGVLRLSSGQRSVAGAACGCRSY